jgi:hypothetical protein
MAYTTIDDPSAYFHTQLYTGDGSSDNAITNDANSGDFKPDWLWIKSRSYADLHNVFDSSRGRDKRIFPNLSNAEGDSSPDNFLKSFDTDGFTTGNDAGMNTNGGTLVAWQWKANGGTTASNTDGSITSTVQANTTAGFSIVTYTGTGSNATIGHGLGVAPSWVLCKDRDGTGVWVTWQNTLAGNQALELQSTNGVADEPTSWNSTVPSSTVFSVGTRGGTNASGNNFVAYCFAEKQGYSKFGSYTGNGNADGTFVYTGFKPAWIMTKRTDANNEAWNIQDNKRSPFNVQDNFIQTDSDAEGSAGGTGIWDVLSNGFKLRQNLSSTNNSGSNYIYMAFAESPFVSSEGVPTTAR